MQITMSSCINDMEVFVYRYQADKAKKVWKGIDMSMFWQHNRTDRQTDRQTDSNVVVCDARNSIKTIRKPSLEDRDARKYSAV